MLILRITTQTKGYKMGFDLYSTKKHHEEKGGYFRNSVWSWRPLADYVLEHTGVIEEKDKRLWHSNDNLQVSKETAQQIANQLKALIEQGHTDKHIKEIEQTRKNASEHNKQVAKIFELLKLKVEMETGKEAPIPRDYPKEDHDLWEFIYHLQDPRESYPFTMENVKEFIEFCEHSEGFTIG